MITLRYQQKKINSPLPITPIASAKDPIPLQKDLYSIEHPCCQHDLFNTEKLI